VPSSRPRDRRAKLLLWMTNHVVSRVIFHAPRMWWYRTVMGYEIGHGSVILVDVRFAARRRLRVGRHSVINNGCRIDNRGHVAIGDGVSLSYGTTIWTKGHVIDASDFRTASAPVTLADRVWTCAGAVILPGVTMGEGSVALTSSVVTKDVAPYEVVGGNPGRPIRKRSEDLEYVIDDYRPWVPFFG
jgi:acetyltransferase-like isoleucine patch superfamily enzyme